MYPYVLSAAVKASPQAATLVYVRMYEVCMFVCIPAVVKTPLQAATWYVYVYMCVCMYVSV